MNERELVEMELKAELVQVFSTDEWMEVASSPDGATDKLYARYHDSGNYTEWQESKIYFEDIYEDGQPVSCFKIVLTGITVAYDLEEFVPVNTVKDVQNIRRVREVKQMRRAIKGD